MSILEENLDRLKSLETQLSTRSEPLNNPVVEAVSSLHSDVNDLVESRSQAERALQLQEDEPPSVQQTPATPATISRQTLVAYTLSSQDVTIKVPNPTSKTRPSGPPSHSSLHIRHSSHNRVRIYRDRYCADHSTTTSGKILGTRLNPLSTCLTNSC